METNPTPTKHAVHYSTGQDTWATPKPLFNHLHAEFRFALDAAALRDTAKVPDNYYGPDHTDPARHDALTRDWVTDANGGAVWLNPPYSRPHQANFLRKARQEADRGATVVMLIPARTDTAVWHDVVMTGEVRFVRGRVKFEGATAGAPFPSAIVIFRPTDRHDGAPRASSFVQPKAT